MKTRLVTLTTILGLGISLATSAQDNGAPPGGLQVAGDLPSASQASSDQLAQLAQELNNPVAALISVPFQNNFDFGGGPHNKGFQYRLNFQPVIPHVLNDNWNLITRTIIPFIHQSDLIGSSVQDGLGDSTESWFFSPRNPGPGGLIWGAGPDLYIPTATATALGTGKWGAGPTGLLLWQQRGWTYGALVNHIWSFAGAGSRPYMSSTFLQPFLSYTTKAHTTFGVNTESSYNWENYQWTVPLNVSVTQLIKIGKLPVNLQFGGRYYAQRPAGGPNWGLRFTVTLVLPKG